MNARQKKPLVLGIIPARGGSKGIPRKNLYPLKGIPLIAYSIFEAKKAQLLVHTIVSTDDLEIAKISEQYGAQVPFLRPPELATDQASNSSVALHAVHFMEQYHQLRYDFIVLLQPTTPFRKAQDIDQSISKILETDCDTIVSLTDVGANHPARMYRIENDSMCPIFDEGESMRPRQQLPPIYIRSGDIYTCKRDSLIQTGKLMGQHCRPIIIPSERAINIDSHTDLELAKLYVQKHWPMEISSFHQEISHF